MAHHVLLWSARQLLHEAQRLTAKTKQYLSTRPTDLLKGKATVGILLVGILRLQKL